MISYVNLDGWTLYKITGKHIAINNKCYNAIRKYKIREFIYVSQLERIVVYYLKDEEYRHTSERQYIALNILVISGVRII